MNDIVERTEINRILFYDTETSGLPTSAAQDDDTQPHLVQLAAIVANADTRQVIASIDVVIKPAGWTIDEKAIEAHGITPEYAEAVGISEKLAFIMFHHLWQGCPTVAHNSKFDHQLMAIAGARFDKTQLFNDQWLAADHICTMEIAKPIMKMPSGEKAMRAGYPIKAPKLEEALKHFTDKILVNAHTAIADTEACMDLYWSLQDLD